MNGCGNVRLRTSCKNYMNVISTPMRTLKIRDDISKGNEYIVRCFAIDYCKTIFLSHIYRNLCATSKSVYRIGLYIAKTVLRRKILFFKPSRVISCLFKFRRTRSKLEAKIVSLFYYYYSYYYLKTIN